MKVRLTNLEYEELTKASKSSKCMSDYFRQRVFRKGVGLIDPKEFIRSMDEICLEMKRIGNNINQLARYVNIHKEEVNHSPAEIVLPSGRKVIKKTDASTPKTTRKVVSLEQQEQQQATATKDGRRVIKAKKAAAQTEEEQPRASLSMAARG